MKQYWMDIDAAFDKLDSHSGSFYALHRVYTPQFLAHLKSLLERAAEAAKNDAACAARVTLHAEGFRNAEQYILLREQMNKGDVTAAHKTYGTLLARIEAQVKSGQSNHYTANYLKRFVGAHVDAAATATAGKRVALVLPDRMRMNYDPDDKGVTDGWAGPQFDDSQWKQVVTWSDTLDAQGLPDRKTILWYRTTIDLPALKGKPTLFFVEVDGAASVFVNGKAVGANEKKRVSFTIDPGDALRPGRNVIAVRVDHSRITDLFLGGILRPVYLLEEAP